MTNEDQPEQPTPNQEESAAGGSGEEEEDDDGMGALLGQAHNTAASVKAGFSSRTLKTGKGGRASFRLEFKCYGSES